MEREEGIKNLKLKLEVALEDLECFEFEINEARELVEKLEAELGEAIDNPKWVPQEQFRPGQEAALRELRLNNLIEKQKELAADTEAT